MKIKPLPSIEKVADTFFYDDVLEDLLTEYRDLAYTRLIEGIEGMRKPVIHDTNWAEGYNQALLSIIEKVVKPLYGKE